MGGCVSASVRTTIETTLVVGRGVIVGAAVTIGIAEMFGTTLTAALSAEIVVAMAGISGVAVRESTSEDGVTWSSVGVALNEIGRSLNVPGVGTAVFSDAILPPGCWQAIMTAPAATITGPLKALSSS